MKKKTEKKNYGKKLVFFYNEKKAFKRASEREQTTREERKLKAKWKIEKNTN